MGGFFITVHVFDGKAVDFQAFLHPDERALAAAHVHRAFAAANRHTVDDDVFHFAQRIFTTIVAGDAHHVHVVTAEHVFDGHVFHRNAPREQPHRTVRVFRVQPVNHDVFDRAVQPIVRRERHEVIVHGAFEVVDVAVFAVTFHVHTVHIPPFRVAFVVIENDVTDGKPVDIRNLHTVGHGVAIGDVFEREVTHTAKTHGKSRVNVRQLRVGRKHLFAEVKIAFILIGDTELAIKLFAVFARKMVGVGFLTHVVKVPNTAVDTHVVRPFAEIDVFDHRAVAVVRQTDDRGGRHTQRLVRVDLQSLGDHIAFFRRRKDNLRRTTVEHFLNGQRIVADTVTK